jgi:hypothetical protein
MNKWEGQAVDGVQLSSNVITEIKQGEHYQVNVRVPDNRLSE